eukprot:CAMPEP_0174292548 /NCGR_PEP_ID=MMETSP0809-20121228/35820_1 /TAXON_ID=73025 ORGANISM="Eutreptiella gymnastica-like, Strain CCMP1594" /NCGR_SAMPLE_ID=MMETSP0809 /ASSEMBLY_ACC=CAM_ASM_000658 /LENGTH=72 /DNA_ID=CAMNT_0015392697 /DNA_START=465 /DNA_END=680 /DNA_ORIENTATION=-
MATPCGAESMRSIWGIGMDCVEGCKGLKEAFKKAAPRHPKRASCHGCSSGIKGQEEWRDKEEYTQGSGVRST